MTELKTYSPSQTTTFCVCPVKWWNSYKAGEHGKGLVPAKVTNLQAYDRLMGDAGHRMLAGWYLTGDMQAALVAAREAVDLGLDAIIHGTTLYDPPSADQMKAELERLAGAYMKRYPTEAWQVLGVERLLEHPALCKLDLVIRDADGEPAIVEHKFPGPKARLEQQAGRWRMAYQPMNYCWAVDEAKQLFGLTKPCRRIIMNFVQRAAKFDPAKHLVRYNIEVKEHLLGIHKQQAHRLWAQMRQAEAFAAQSSEGPACHKETVGASGSKGANGAEQVRAIDNPIWPNWEACDTRWGRCEFIDYCESGWDETVEQGHYRSKGAPSVVVATTHSTAI